METWRRLLRSVVEMNCRVSAQADRLVGRCVGRARGREDFTFRVLPALLRPGLRVLDLGGGRSPCISETAVARLGLHVTGLDISAAELQLAPPGRYQATIVADASRQAIPGQYDLIFSRNVLEHVADVPGLIQNLAAALADGGTMTHLVPCGNAPFAVLNRLLGQRVSKRLLESIYPDTAGQGGFPAYYHHCTPSRLAAVCRRAGLNRIEVQPYFASDYLRFCVPAHLAEICRQSLLKTLAARDLAESFLIIAGKN